MRTALLLIAAAFFLVGTAWMFYVQLTRKDTISNLLGSIGALVAGAIAAGVALATNTSSP